ncbi:MAG: dipeptidase [Fusobacterium sp.]|uniref:dipeptidase n=1 Tax=Fusobacterium sp. TaxID=68766 RepID=UPI002A75F32A|nr:dipeptidase [Fusobacterium sp.]MDY2980108.1 dipeptidase [Fusobacterium sp.]
MKIFDMHADIWYDIHKKKNQGIEKNRFRDYHLERFKKGEIFGGVFIAWLDDKFSKAEEEKEMMVMINATMNEINNNTNLFHILKSKKDFENISNGKLNVLMGIEGLRAIGKNLDWLDTFYNLGFRSATLTWNEENELGTGARGNTERGLTELGKLAVKKMNKLGMIIDVSHANEKTFWDIWKTSEKPIIASHSNCKTLCDVPRNLSDEQIKAIAKKGGLIGINAYVGFIKECEYSKSEKSKDIDANKRPNLKDLVDHIDYLVKLVGIDSIGFGFDFCEYLYEDETTNPIGLENCSKAQNIIQELRKRGYKEEEIEKLAYKNFFEFGKKFFE